MLEPAAIYPVFEDQGFAKDDAERISTVRCSGRRAGRDRLIPNDDEYRDPQITLCLCGKCRDASPSQLRRDHLRLRVDRDCLVGLPFGARIALRTVELAGMLA